MPCTVDCLEVENLEIELQRAYYDSEYGAEKPVHVQ